MKPTSRRSLLALSATALAAGALTIPSTAFAATGPDVAMGNASVAGGVTSAQAGQPLTFVFKARNNGPGPADLAITLIWAHGFDLNRSTSRISCVLPNGSLIEPDGQSCEPGIIRPGQRPSSLVFNGEATGTDIDVKVCVSNLSGGVDPVPRNNCRDPQVAVPGPSVHIDSAVLIPPEKTHVNILVSVACKAPANVTSYFSTVVWQGISNDPSLIQGQGQTQVICDGVKRQYSLDAVRDAVFDPKVFKAGEAMSQSTVGYCVQLDPDNAACYGLGGVIEQQMRFRRL